MITPEATENVHYHYRDFGLCRPAILVAAGQVEVNISPSLGVQIESAALGEPTPSPSV